MKVSILLVSYNQEAFIKECVESILMQEVSFGLEVIVADDHSTDKTLQIITNLLSVNKFPYRVLDADRNLGMHSNYKRGIAACSGEYIAIIEGDDYWCDPKRLEKHITFLDTHHDCVMSFNRLVILNEKKGSVKAQKWEHDENLVYITTAMLAEKNHIGNLSACVIRKSAFNKLPPEIHEIGFADWLLGMAMGEHGTLVKFGETMSVYRIHEKSLWSGKNEMENINRMISHIIDINDRFFGYRYHNEFIKHKRRLIAKHKQHIIRHWFNQHIPTAILRYGKVITPIRLRRWIVNRIK